MDVKARRNTHIKDKNMKNSTKAILALLGVLFSGMVILLSMIILLHAPREAINTGNLTGLVIVSVLYMIGMGLLGVDSILKRK